jgi:hypothetical protein
LRGEPRICILTPGDPEIVRSVGPPVRAPQTAADYPLAMKR